ncbi:hypothetical protein [uncultured Celeribacter sp.]|uniref:hypothetical protein n=1 Tax=uncultured Celeribacter sp. TaxID=1303376 RepID=UPI002AA7D277|nr:hypothetical protein [uncultured Celeribacter sp.]
MSDTQANDAQRVTLHIGLHFTSADYILKAIGANRTCLKEHGIYVPPKRHAWGTINAMLKRLDGLPPIAEEATEVRTTLLGKAQAQHLFLSDERWASPLRTALEGKTLYPEIGTHVRAVAEIFSSSELQIGLSLINPAIFLSESFASGTGAHLLKTFVEEVDPATLRWRDTLNDLRAALPDIPLVVWAEEDAPLIWPAVMHRLFHLPPDVPLSGRILPLKPLLHDEGYERLQTYLTSHPPKTREQYERVVMVFLNKYGREEALAPRCSIPGWGAEDIEVLTAHYEEDLDSFAQDDSITFLQPVTQPD